MKVIHITGPAGSGKSTLLALIEKQFTVASKQALVISPTNLTADVRRALEYYDSEDYHFRAVLIDEYDPERIDLDALAGHACLNVATVYVAYQIKA